VRPGALGREDQLLRVATQLETAAPWSDRHPALPSAGQWAIAPDGVTDVSAAAKS